MTPNDPTVTPERIDVERQEAVTVVFADGQECRFQLEELRVNCPCATCRAPRDGGGRPAMPPELSIAHAKLVGNWGLGITWSDGHATGIFPWETLRRWCGAEEG